VVKEEIEKDPELKKKLYDKYHSALDQPIGQTTISEYLGGPWLRKYQINLIAEALAQLRDIEQNIISEDHLKPLPSFQKSKELRKAVKKTWRDSRGEYVPPKDKVEQKQRDKIIQKVVDKVAERPIEKHGKRNGDEIPISKFTEEMIKEKVASQKIEKPKDKEIELIRVKVEEIIEISRKLKKKVDELLIKLEEEKINSINGLKPMIIQFEMMELIKELKNLWDYMALGRKQLN